MQFGLPYGRNRQGALPSLDDAHALLESAWERGIRAFDTAEAYGLAAYRLASWLDRTGRISDAEVVTKVSVADMSDADKVARAASRFGGARRLRLLSHGAADEASWRAFQQIASRMSLDAGASVYEPSEVRAIIGFGGASTLQVPGNILDQSRIEARGMSPVTLDVRSAFLQGVLLDEPHVAESRVPGAGEIAAAVRLAAAHLELPASALLLSGLMQQLRPSDRVVVGADSPLQLAEWLTPDAWATHPPTVFCDEVRRRLPPSLPSNLLDPRQWRSPA